MSGKAAQGEDSGNDDVYTIDADEDNHAPQDQRKPVKPAKARQRPRRQQQKTNIVSEENVQDESRAMQPYKINRSNKELSPAQGHQRIEKQGAEQGGQVQKKGKDEDNGLKLRLDLNLDIEVELKASIRGDLTLALL
ncbi:hypothetical protein BDV18DRAFT_164687 [Aspergillus unguis]